jgi:hypothetical protein
MLAIDEELRSHLESGVAVGVATRSADLKPNAVRGWGIRVSPDGRAVEVFLDRPAAGTSVTNLQDNGRISICTVDVSNLHSVQLKGRCVEVADPDPQDWPWIERHREAFTEEVGKIGYPRQVMRHLWSTQVIKVRFVVEEFYDQTPGPKAGRAL